MHHIGIQNLKEENQLPSLLTIYNYTLEVHPLHAKVIFAKFTSNHRPQYIPTKVNILTMTAVLHVTITKGSSIFQSGSLLMLISLRRFMHCICQVSFGKFTTTRPQSLPECGFGQSDRDQANKHLAYTA